jgi:hypothetical protein
MFVWYVITKINLLMLVKVNDPCLNEEPYEINRYNMQRY